MKVDPSPARGQEGAGDDPDERTRHGTRHGDHRDGEPGIVASSRGRTSVADRYPTEEPSHDGAGDETDGGVLQPRAAIVGVDTNARDVVAPRAAF